MATAFGPQGPNYSTARPATVGQATATDTWCIDCTAAGANDGTILDASFLNMLIANLRTAVDTAGVPLDESDTMLYNAITAIATGGAVAGLGLTQTAGYPSTISVDIASLAILLP